MDTTRPEPLPEPDPLPAYRSPEPPRSAAGTGSGTGTGTGTEPGSGSGPRPAWRTSADRFFAGVRSWDVVRPDHDRRIAGVCAGLARRWNMSPTSVRILFVLVGLLTGLGLAAYGVLWLLLPHQDGRIHAQQALDGTFTAGFVGGVVAIVVDHPLGDPWSGSGPWHHSLVPFALVALGIWWLVRRSGTPAAPGPR